VLPELMVAFIEPLLMLTILLFKTDIGKFTIITSFMGCLFLI
jgi:hypothetical protein